MFAESLAPFFAIAGFATPVVFDGALSANALFDNAYVDANGVYATGPQLTCASADIASVSVGSAVVVNATSYTVQGIQPDGTGVTVLHLQRT